MVLRYLSRLPRAKAGTSYKVDTLGRTLKIEAVKVEAMTIEGERLKRRDESLIECL